MSNFTITPEQSRSKSYLRALVVEITPWHKADPGALERSRINQPEILAYKGRILANRTDVTSFAGWTSFLVSDYGPRETCLSLGSGIGRIESFLIQSGFTKRFDSIDLNPRANQVARNQEPRINAQEKDLNFVYLEPKSYDFILCYGILHHLINLEHVLEQINRALKPDGLLLIHEYVGETRWQFTHERLVALNKLLPGFDFTPPPLWQLVGFESIRSGELLQLISTQFGSTCEREVSFGGVYCPFIICTKPKADAHIQKVIALDEKTSKEESLAPCYHVGLYRKSDAQPSVARPWSDAELRLRLVPSTPVIVQIVRALKWSPLGPPLSAIKRAARSMISKAR